MDVCMCVCMRCICECMSMYVRTYVRMYVCTYTCTCEYTYIHVSAAATIYRYIDKSSYHDIISHNTI